MMSTQTELTSFFQPRKKRKLDIKDGCAEIKEKTPKLSRVLDNEKTKVSFQQLGKLSPKKRPVRQTQNLVKTPSTSGNIENFVQKKEKPPVVRSLQYENLKEVNKNAQKLGPEEVRSRLANCGKLQELKAKLATVNNCAEKVKSFKAAQQPVLNKFKDIHFDVTIPVSPQKLKSPVKSASPVKKVVTPAYQRYRHLTTPPSLVLPAKYSFLNEVFRCVDTVVSMLHNRQEMASFTKLKPAVQEMLRRTFGLQHLGQIKHVFPTAYFFQQERIVPKFRDSPKKAIYELTVQPNLNYKQEIGTTDTQNRTYYQINASSLRERKEIFRSQLLATVMLYHEEFLQSLDPPISISRGKLQNWHPQFNVDDVPDIMRDDLPQPPDQLSCSTAKDVLQKACGILSMNSRMERALKNTAAESQIQNPAPLTVENKPENSAAPTPNPTTTKNIKGIPQGLLEKIRAKEAEKVQQQMMRDPKETEEIRMLSRLPGMARILRNFFLSEKKAAIPMEAVVQKLSDSYRTSLSSSELQAHVKLLCKREPLWITQHLVRKINYVKIKKTMDVNALVNRLNDAIKKSTQ